MNLFIDTNIYLTFYHYSSDDLEELKKLAVAIQTGPIKLYLTQQVKDEFKRNREAKIADALKRFSEQKLNTQFPQMCKEYGEYKELREAIKQYDESKEKLSQKLRSDIESKSLGADKVIAELFEKAEIFDHSDPIFSAAQMRMTVGNPPGKNGSYGDAINWETLLKEMPNDALYLITDDKDYISQINDNKLAEFLLEEWKGKKASDVFFYRKLSAFFKDKFPTIKLASEMEKDLAIAELVNSGSFKTTHAAIAKLSKFGDFTNAQINEIVDAATANSQIYQISGDYDVKNFLQNLVAGKESVIETAKLYAFNAHYQDISMEVDTVADEDIPF